MSDMACERLTGRVVRGSVVRLSWVFTGLGLPQAASHDKRRERGPRVDGCSGEWRVVVSGD